MTVSPRRESPATRTHGALAYAADGVSTYIGECSWPWCSDVSETTTRKDADPVKTYVLGLHPQEHHFVHTVHCVSHSVYHGLRHFLVPHPCYHVRV